MYSGGSWICQRGRAMVSMERETIGTGVNPAGDAGDVYPLQYFASGTSMEIPHQYYYVRSDTADQY